MRQAGNSIIEANKLVKTFGAVTAVDHISFNVNKGEIFGFLGPNGAGKTTTIRMLTGLLTPNSGSIIIEGTDIQKHPIEAKSKMGVVPETGNLYVDLTARQNIILAGKFYGLSGRDLEERTNDLLRKFAIHQRKDDAIRTFSKGMKQRVTIAAAIVHNPDILFLDEPTSGLDVQSQRLIKQIVKEINRKGTTIFLTTHNIEEANVLCQRVGIINKGKMAAIDTPENLKKTFQETQSVEISFDKPIDDDVLSRIPLAQRVEKLPDKWKLYTDNPDKLAKHLVKLAQDRDLTLTCLQICASSLEDAFVKLTEGDTHAH